VPSEVKKMQKAKEAFKSDGAGGVTQNRSYPFDPACAHKVSKGECFCIDKCAEHMQRCVEEWAEDPEYEDNQGEEWQSTDQNAPFHKKVVEVAKTCTFSTTAAPLYKHIPQERRVPGVWHCTHNCRHAMWILLKDMAGKYNMIDNLQRALASLGLGKIKCAPKDRKKTTGGFSSVESIMIDEKADGVRMQKVAEEDRNDGCARTSMDGMELIKVMKNFNQIVGKMEEVGIPAKSQFRWDGFKVGMHKALTAFNAAAALALADLWEEDKSHEMGENFRKWADAIIDDLGPEVGLPYAGRSYLDILPAHWLCEKDHLEQHARENWLAFGVSPGVNSDAPCEAGEPQLPTNT
jgi:hypothetical protein